MRGFKSAQSKASETWSCKVLTLPSYLLEDIFNRLEIASAIAIASCACRSFREAGRRVQSIRLICLSKYHEIARAGVTSNPPSTLTLKDGKGESSASGAEASKGVTQFVSSDDESGDERIFVVFREVVVGFLQKKPNLVQLRIEIEAELQSHPVPETERTRTDFWLSDPQHLKRWVPSVRSTLKHLCIVDYGQQAIVRRTTILAVLSQNCKLLMTLDLRNMFIDSTGLEDMPSVVSFTLRCVKVTGDTLQHINAHMRNLKTLALLGVFGVTHGNLDFPHMKVLCLGLSTVAREVSMHLPSLVKLQLKMLCPERLTVTASDLKFMAFNLDIREISKVEFKDLRKLQELLYGASSFETLLKIVAANPNLEKLFLDIPCMALGEDGKWLGVLKGIPITLPSFKQLLMCERLEVLNVGPGLWHSMEENLGQLSTVEKWPPFKRLTLHMIPQNLDICVAILRILLKPGLVALKICVHTHSLISYETIVSAVKEIVSHFGQDFRFESQPWTKSLDFSCFSF
ncbi:uncharacterized protein [Physcomitrium patens]|uniref:F-box domain-containing protein n=1 Tax=Physcomitrium patens TaxID=3218 RepID=A0A2K1JML2_PHYPA|nr:F-box/LRR-repeat protein At4g29420-like [Physcomitrium patens]PNR42781.1 hypothetical protein PHYPA_017611 [Physcomitrium patens]|eukprot:XP_024393451.1 F-box/LRR-repeat protein At4g29420-like [Physcomitrella patens]